jgi:mono/diheme cytochrome c family protein
MSLMSIGLFSLVMFAQKPASPQPAASVAAVESSRALINKYCAGCHGDSAPRAGLSLTKFDVAHPEKNPQAAEKIIRKLHAGMMPPPGSPRPAAADVKTLTAHLEKMVDQFAAARVEPGRRSFQRLTRTEYANSIHDLLSIDVDVEGLLPPDTISSGFDNIADSQQFSPALMEGYIRAAEKISREALGDPSAEPASATFKLDRTASQLRRVDGAPFGTRGGIVVTHNFPADGEYVFKMLLHGSPTGALYGSGGNYGGSDQIELSVDGERRALLTIAPSMSESTPEGLTLSTGPITVKAGPRKVAAVFVQRTSLLVDDLITPIEHPLADTNIGIYKNISTLPHLREFEIGGPFRTTGVSDTESRRLVFVCRPSNASEELPCATKIISNFAAKAYRRATTAEDLEGLMSFYQQARSGADFETGIRTAVQAILASPNFVFRFERAPAGVKPGATYRISDLELASRLSYFVWATGPDEELLTVAKQGRLRDPLVLEKQTRRMLQDPRSDALSTKFASLWLRLPDLLRMHPDALMYPQYDRTVTLSMKKETELFFDSIVREDRNILDLLTANYTFLDERTAKHYGYANIVGSRFRRVEITDPNRRGLGLLGQGSVLVLTSVADRTSPVQRGKWVMEVLLGTPPPPPPANVPPFNDTKATDNGKPLTVRERMEIHRANPACASCHRMIDPIGLALENFDVTGQWRTLDKGVSIATATELFDGTAVDSPAGLRDALLKHSEAIVGNFTDHLMTYALGRRVEYYDMPAVRAIIREAGKNNNRFSSFVLGIVKSAAFQMSRAETTTVDK